MKKEGGGQDMNGVLRGDRMQGMSGVLLGDHCSKERCSSGTVPNGVLPSKSIALQGAELESTV